MRRTRYLHCIAASVALVALGSQNARADTKLWILPSSGVFTTPANWTGGVPGTADFAWFNYLFGHGNPNPITVTLPGGLDVEPPVTYVNHELRIGPGDVTFANSVQPLRGPSHYRLNSLIGIGESGGPSIFTTRLGSLSSPRAVVGYISGSAGTLNVNAGSFDVTGSTQAAELIIGDAGAGTVNVNAGARMNVSGAEGSAIIGARAGIAGTTNVSGAGAVWNNTANSAAAPLVVGGLGSGNLNITAGGHVNNFRAHIADQPGSVGAVTVNGAGSTWSNREVLIVARGGNGTLTVSGGGQVNAETATIGSEAGASGTARVMGQGSKWTIGGDLNVGGITSLNGESGAGALHVSAGGEVFTGQDASVGPAGPATATVAGMGSRWTIGRDFLVEEEALVNVTAGGAVETRRAVHEGVVTVAGAGSSLNVRDDLYVTSVSFAPGAPGILNLSGGGRVNTRLAFVGGGIGLGGGGRVTVDGLGSTLAAAEHLYVGFQGEGEIRVTGGGQVTSAAAQIGVSGAAAGSVTVRGAGSQWTNTQNLYVGVAGTADLTVAAGGAVTVNGLLSIGSRGKLQGNGNVTADVRNGGAVAPGVFPSFIMDEDIGTLRVSGHYTQATSGRLLIDIASTSAHDRLLVSGGADLAGRLQFELRDNFSPAVGDRFTILSSASRTGTFEPGVTISPSPVILVPVYTPTEVLLLAVARGENTWAIDASGNSSAGANWTAGTPPGAIDDKVAFTTIITANRTVTVDSPFTAGSIFFNDDNNYTVQGPAAITLDVSAGNASIAVRNLHGSGTHTISAPLVLNDPTAIDVPAASTLNMTGQMTAAPAASLTKTGPGTLGVRNIRAAGLTITGGTVGVIASGGGGDGTSVLKALSIAPTARLDLGNNSLVLDYTGAATPLADVRAQIVSGFAGGTWIGNGITSASAAANLSRAIGYGEAAALLGPTGGAFAGQNVDATALLVRLTLKGDANLDGVVSFPDLVAIAQNYNGANKLWPHGDFNYDGKVNFNDLVSLAQNYGTALPAAVPGASAQFQEDLAAAFANVPETSMLPITAAICGFLHGRRRSR